MSSCGTELILSLALLDLLRTPTGIGFAHVGGWFDGRNKLENAVDEANNTDNGAGNDAQGVAVEKDGADEDVDWRIIR